MDALKSEKYVILLPTPRSCVRCQMRAAPFMIAKNDEMGANISEVFSCPHCLTNEEKDLLCIPDRAVSEAEFNDMWKAKVFAWNVKNHGRLVIEDDQFTVSFSDRMFRLVIDDEGVGTVTTSANGQAGVTVYGIDSGRAFLYELALFYGYSLTPSAKLEEVLS